MSKRLPLCLSAAIGTLTVLLSTPAIAQSDPPAGEPTAAKADEIHAPEPLAPLTAAYPANGNGDAVVTLAITVNRDGSVRSARVISGEEPFATAALGATTGFRFKPAARNGKPIAAVIRAEIRFTAPSPPPEAPPPTAAASSPAPASAPLEVTVHGERLPPGVTSYSRAEVRILPGAFGDPFRAIETLPGVTPLASGLPYFYVRGAPPGNVGYFVDGIRVPLLFHMGLGPSIIHPSIIERVDLYPGGYPAAFGSFSGGIVTGTTRDPDPAWHGEASVRLVDSGLMVTGPLGDRGSFFVAGRFSYTGALLSAISSDVDLNYWDYQARATYDLGPRDTLTVFAFGAYDHLASKDTTNATDGSLFDTTFHRVDLRYDHRFAAPDSHLRVAMALGYDQTSFGYGSYARDHMASVRVEGRTRLGTDVLLRAGADVNADDYDASLYGAFPSSPGFTSLFGPHVDVSTAMYADAVIDVSKRFSITPGVRTLVFTAHGESDVSVEPRLVSRLSITKELRLVQAHGLAAQPPSFIVAGPGFVPDVKGGLQRSVQSSIGLEVDLPLDISASLTGFRNAFFNMTDALSTSSMPTGKNDFPSTFDARSIGSSIGLELLVRRRLTHHLGGFLSYTLSRSERLAEKGMIPSTFDRTHVMSAAAVYNFESGYRVGSRVLFYTGNPILVSDPRVAFVARDIGRLPPFARLDVRAEKRWPVRKTGWVSLVLEVQNATLSVEALSQRCALFSCTTNTLGPVTIPSLGVEGGF